MVGGQSVEVNEYPWMVGLKRSGSSHPSCGAALLNSNWLVTVHVYTSTQPKPVLSQVTAAHCIMDTWVLDIALLGEHDVTTDTESIITIVSVLIILRWI